MVHRKAPDKLGTKDDTKNIKTEEPSLLIQPPASQNLESRNKGGPELKKMMKKSRSIKRSEFDCLKTNSLKKRTKTKPAAEGRPQKPSLDKVHPAPEVTPQKLSPVKVPTTQKQPQIKIPETPPNYMKSTTSSSARKERERLPVSPVNSKTSSDSKILVRKDLNTPKKQSSLGSGQKPGKTFTKTSSLRPVRTLTKTSSNKAGRNSVKKNSGVALYDDQHVRKNTCSSTLKDSKFPSYVDLQPGGTEAEGFSVMKVCPYTYCSLNGHHHAELPPLKQFLSARRRSLKNQKSMRLKSLSSIRRPSEKPKEDVDAGHVFFNKDSATSEDEDSVGLDFFGEFFVQPRVNTSTDDSDDQEKNRFSFDLQGSENTSYLDEDGPEMDGGGRHAKIPDYASESATSFEDNINHDIDFITEEMDILMLSFEYIQTEQFEEDDVPFYHMEAESGLAELNNGNEVGESETDESIFDTSGMDWEEGQGVDTGLDDDQTVSSQVLTAIELPSELTYKAVDILNCYKEVTVHEEMQIAHGEDTEGLNEEYDGLDEVLEVQFSDMTSSEESDTLSGPSLQDLLPSNEDTLENAAGIIEANDQGPNIAEFSLIRTSSEVTDDLLEVSISAEDETSPSNNNAEPQSKGQESNHSEPKMPLKALQDDQDAVAEVGLNLEEQAENHQLLDSVVLETDEINSVPDANDRAQMAEDDEDQLEGKKGIHCTTFPDEQNYTEGSSLKSVPECSTDGMTMEVDERTGAGKTTVTNATVTPGQAQPEKSSNFYKRTRLQRPILDIEVPREFNPRGPNFLPLEPEQDPEKVDLRHQLIDDRKNSEEWMLDYALRQAVNKLAPARKRKVALLVEAFEAVAPLPKYEIHLPHTPTGFAQIRFMQACN